MNKAIDASTLMMKAAWLAHEARKDLRVTAELHRKPQGQIVVGCKVEDEIARYFEITVETDGTLSLSWMNGLRMVKVTKLSSPAPQS